MTTPRRALRCQAHPGQPAPNCGPCAADLLLNEPARRTAPRPTPAAADPEPPTRCPTHLAEKSTRYCAACRRTEHQHDLWRIRSGGPIGLAHTRGAP